MFVWVFFQKRVVWGVNARYSGGIFGDDPKPNVACILCAELECNDSNEFYIFRFAECITWFGWICGYVGGFNGAHTHKRTPCIRSFAHSISVVQLWSEVNFIDWQQLFCARMISIRLQQFSLDELPPLPFWLFSAAVAAAIVAMWWFVGMKCLRARVRVCVCGSISIFEMHICYKIYIRTKIYWLNDGGTNTTKTVKIFTRARHVRQFYIVPRHTTTQLLCYSLLSAVSFGHTKLQMCDKKMERMHINSNVIAFHIPNAIQLDNQNVLCVSVSVSEQVS